MGWGTIPHPTLENREPVKLGDLSQMGDFCLKSQNIFYALKAN